MNDVKRAFLGALWKPGVAVLAVLVAGCVTVRAQTQAQTFGPAIPPFPRGIRLTDPEPFNTAAQAVVDALQGSTCFTRADRESLESLLREAIQGMVRGPDPGYETQPAIEYLQQLMSMVRRKPPCPPPNGRWVFSFETGNYELVSGEIELTFGEGGGYVGSGIEKRWAYDRWVTVGQITLNGDDPLANELARFITDPARLKLYAGFDRRIGPAWTVGLVADVGFGRNSGTVSRIPGTWGPGGITTAAAALNDNFTVSQSWNTSLRARFGRLLSPSLMVYTTAGVDILHMDASINCTLAGACGAVGVPVVASSSSTRAGAAIGAGFEYAISRNLRGRLEYLHSEFGDWKASFGNPATFQTTANIRVATDGVMAGLVYSFGGPSGTGAPRAAPSYPVKAPPLQ